MSRTLFLVLGAFWALLPVYIGAQSATDLAACRLLAPVTFLSHTPEGRAALAANYTVTGGIQTGAIRQATLLPFAEQQHSKLCAMPPSRSPTMNSWRMAWHRAWLSLCGSGSLP